MVRIINSRSIFRRLYDLDLYSGLHDLVHSNSCYYIQEAMQAESFHLDRGFTTLCTHFCGKVVHLTLSDRVLNAPSFLHSIGQ